MRNKIRRTGSGQAIIEFALVMPILVLIIIGIFDLGRGVLANNMIENAARAGARAGIIISNRNNAICAHAQAVAPTLNLTCDQIQVSLPDPRTSGDYQKPITVTVNYTYWPITPIVAQILPNGIHLSAKSTMIVEGVIMIQPQ